MDHQDVVRRGAIERYLLDEIPQPERDEFEQHFFDCRECAEEVRTTAAFLAGAKMELRRSHFAQLARAAAKRPWFEILRRPAVVVPAFALSLNAGGNRGAVPTAATPKDQPLLLAVDIPTAQRFSSYTCVLVAPSGAVVWRLPVSADQAKDAVTISVPSGVLGPGTFRLLVQGRTSDGADPVALVNYRFTLNGSN